MKMIAKENCCQFCKYRKELHTSLPQECKECGFLGYRDKPYTVDIPVKEERDED